MKINIISTIVLTCVCACATARAEDIYLASAAVGANSGADCADAKAYTFFNTAGNWGAGAGKISAGDTVHICGTITASAGSSAFTFQASGTTGNPITLKFEAGAILQAPYWPNAGGIGATGQGFVVVDGGTNGIIQATANGTSLANQQVGDAIHFQSGSNITVKNMSVLNIYVHTGSGSDGDSGGISVIDGSNITIDHNTIADVATSIYYEYGAAKSNVTISNNTIAHTNAGVIVASGGTGTKVTGVAIFGNQMHDFQNWNDSSYMLHHDGIHAWATQTGAQIINLKIYNNRFYGDLGQGTAWIYQENYGNAASDTLIFNNVFDNTASTCTIDCGPSSIEPQGGNLTWGVYNNTLRGGGVAVHSFFLQGASDFVADIRNNISYGFSDVFYINNTGNGIPATLDYNDWFGAAGGDITDNSAGTNLGYSQANFSVTPPTWRTHCSCDAHSIVTAPNLNVVTYVPTAGSGVIGAAANLSGLGITELNSDKAGVARPSGTTAWDMGALQFAAVAGPHVTRSPLNMAYGNLLVGASSNGDQVVTVTNDGGSALTITSIGFTGTNAADFAEMDTCGSLPASLSAGAQCTITVTFTPQAAGARAAVLSLGDSATGSPHTVGLSGTGVLAAIRLRRSSVVSSN